MRLMLSALLHSEPACGRQALSPTPFLRPLSPSGLSPKGERIRVEFYFMKGECSICIRDVSYNFCTVSPSIISFPFSLSFGESARRGEVGEGFR